jgi:hypothetical protein
MKKFGNLIIEHEDHDFEQFEHSDLMVCLKCSLLVRFDRISEGKIIGNKKTGDYLSNDRSYHQSGCRTW